MQKLLHYSITDIAHPHMWILSAADVAKIAPRAGGNLNKLQIGI